MELLYTDARIVVCLKPAGVLSTDEPGGMPELLRRALGEPETGCVRTVHRLDRPVGGVMVFARSRMADSLLSRQVQAHTFQKDYLAVLEGVPAQASGVLEDQLRRDTAARRTCVADAPGPDTASGAAFLPRAGRGRRPRARPHPAGDRAHADPRAVLFPRAAAVRRREIRRGRARAARVVVVPDRVLPPADGPAAAVFPSAPGRRPLAAIPNSIITT
ncbi:MAG: pseudouridine synthase [Acutalibacteraceae bacterium]